MPGEGFEISIGYDQVGSKQASKLDKDFFHILFIAYGANRDVPFLAPDHFISKNDEAPWKTHLGGETILLDTEPWLLDLDYAANKYKGKIGDKHQKQLEDVINILCNVLPDVEDIQCVIKYLGTKKPQPRVEFKTPYGWVRLRDLSLGYKTMIAWIADLARRMYEAYPDSENPIAEPAVVLVDEFDLHLHPKWQRDLMGFLSERFINTQFIVTAHSPLVVQSAVAMRQAGKSVNVAVCKRVGDHVEIENNPESVLGWRIDQILASDLYGVSTYPDEIQSKLDERRKILAKPELSETDEARLEELSKELPYLPTAERKEDREALALIHEVAAELKTKRASS